MEECLPPHDYAGFGRLNAAIKSTRIVTGEHVYFRYGFRQLLEPNGASHLAARHSLVRRADRDAPHRRAGGGLRHPGDPARRRRAGLRALHHGDAERSVGGDVHAVSPGRRRSTAASRRITASRGRGSIPAVGAAGGSGGGGGGGGGQRRAASLMLIGISTRRKTSRTLALSRVWDDGVEAVAGEIGHYGRVRSPAADDSVLREGSTSAIFFAAVSMPPILAAHGQVQRTASNLLPVPLGLGENCLSPS